MKGKLKGLIAASFLLLFATASASAQVCPPLPECADLFERCSAENGGPNDYCVMVYERCIAENCGGGGGPGIPPA